MSQKGTPFGRKVEPSSDGIFFRTFYVRSFSCMEQSNLGSKPKDISSRFLVRVDVNQSALNFKKQLHTSAGMIN